MSNSFNVSYLISSDANSDLSSNPLQVGEDNTINTSDEKDADEAPTMVEAPPRRMMERRHQNKNLKARCTLVKAKNLARGMQAMLVEEKTGGETSKDIYNIFNHATEKDQSH
ncbi:unnamed protein product [Cochlearia groenlandica]